MLKIGVTACFMYPDPYRVQFGSKTLMYLGQELCQFLVDKNASMETTVFSKMPFWGVPV